MQFWVEELEYGFAFFGLIGVLLLAPWIRAQYRRFGRMRGWPAVVSAATVLYFCGLVAFTLFPLPDFTPKFCARHDSYSHWRLDPFHDLQAAWSYEQTHPLLQTLTSPAFLQLAMNVALFVPLGFLVAYRWRGGIIRAVGTSAGVSLLIELTQGTGLWGLAECPYRLADVDDLMMNTLGGVVGWVVARAIGRRLPDPRPALVPDLDPPGLPRRGLAVALDALLYLLGMVAVLLPLEERFGGPDRQSAGFAAVGIGVSACLFVVFPLFRRLRSTPGMSAVTTVRVRVDGQRPSVVAVLVGWAARWLPVAIFGISALAVLLLADLIVAWRRSDGRSLNEVLAGVRVETVQQAREDASSPTRGTSAPTSRAHRA